MSNRIRIHFNSINVYNVFVTKINSNVDITDINNFRQVKWLILLKQRCLDINSTKLILFFMMFDCVIRVCVLEFID